MKEFILSDLHIGYDGSQYDIMEQAIKFIQKHAKKGDRVLGLGDWWHINEEGFGKCMAHPFTGKFRELAKEIPTRFLSGNHDHQFEDYRDHPEKGNPIAPIELIYPFADGGIYYCHGHEYDPEVQHVGWLPTLLGHLQKAKSAPRPIYDVRRTPFYIREKMLTETYLLVVQLIYTRASLDLIKRAKEGGQVLRGMILGHTHLPLIQQSPDLPILMDDGDMRQSGSFMIREENRFSLMRWDDGKKEFLVSSSVMV